MAMMVMMMMMIIGIGTETLIIRIMTSELAESRPKLRPKGFEPAVLS